MKQDIEQFLISGNSIDDLISKKMEEEINETKKEANEKLKEKIITDIKKVPKHLIFTKHSIFKVFNRENKTQSFINGLQAESMIGLQKSLYSKIKEGLIASFATEKEFIKFEKAKIKDD